MICVGSCDEDNSSGGGLCWMDKVASDILSGSFEASGVLAEEFDEAYVPAESPQEGKDARVSQAHEHSGRSEGDRGPPPARQASDGRLIFATE
jgi:hypothetical protein